MLSNQGCLLIYTSVGNTWISLLSMLHNHFPESFRLFFIMYLVFMCTVPTEERLGEALPCLQESHPSQSFREVSHPRSLMAQYSWAVTGYLLFEQSNWGEMLP